MTHYFNVSSNTSKAITEIHASTSGESLQPLDSASTSTSGESLQPLDSTSTSQSKANKPSSVKTITPFLERNQSVKAEILWCLESINTHASLRTASHGIDIMKLMFPNVEELQNIKLGKDKIGYSLVYGLAPYFKMELKREIIKCDNFVLLFDESLNKISTQQQMDIVIR